MAIQISFKFSYQHVLSFCSKNHYAGDKLVLEWVKTGGVSWALAIFPHFDTINGYNSKTVIGNN